MDPNATLAAMIEAYEAANRTNDIDEARGYYEEMAEHADNLINWIDRGGFTPVIKTEMHARLLIAWACRDARRFAEV